MAWFKKNSYVACLQVLVGLKICHELKVSLSNPGVNNMGCKPNCESNKAKIAERKKRSIS